MDANSWFYGTKLCTIRPDRILAPSMQRNTQMTAQVMQGAFCTYYQGHQAANKITDVLYRRNYSEPAKKKIWDMRSAMQKDLRDAADLWGWNDLKWCFEHMAKNGGKYLDDTWNGWKGICNIPMGVSNFLDEIEKRGGKFSRSISDFNALKDKARREAEAGRWKECGETMGKIKTNLDTYGPYLWVCIPGNPGQAPKYVELIGKCIGYAGTVHGVLSKGLDAEAALHKLRFDPNAKRDLFVETMAGIVGGLPIFGQLYAEAIRGVPNAIDYFRKIARERDAMIEQIMR
jgi:hypothetical protein